MDKKEAYSQLKKKIIANELAPGQVLLEKELMERLEVGRTPLREIFLDLQRDGLVIAIPRYGTFVTPLSNRELKNIIELRVKLEEFVAELLCQRIDDEGLAAIANALGRYEALVEAHSIESASQEALAELIEAESEFHRATYLATKNDYLIEMLRKLQTNSMRFWNYLGWEKHVLQNHQEELKSIFLALAKRDAACCKRLMREHVMDFVKDDRLANLPAMEQYMLKRE